MAALLGDPALIENHDVINPQADTATEITGAGGDYVFTVRANQPGLYAAYGAP